MIGDHQNVSLCTEGGNIRFLSVAHKLKEHGGRMMLKALFLKIKEHSNRTMLKTLFPDRNLNKADTIKTNT